MFDIRADEELLQSSIVQVNSIQNNIFGTGFIVGQDDKYAYVLTCAHVLENMGERDSIRVRGRRAAVEESGEGNGIDLAVLRVDRSPMDKFLFLQFYEPVEREVIAIGFFSYGEHRSRGNVIGRVKDRLLFENRSGTISMYVWDFEVAEDSRHTLIPGFSGSPVFDRHSGKVIGIITYKESETRGIVICLENIYKIWPKPRLGHILSGRATYLKEEEYFQELSKDIRDELRFLKKKQRLEGELKEKRGQRKIVILCNFAEDLLYQASRIKNEANYNQQLVTEMYTEARRCFLEAVHIQKQPRMLIGMAKALFEEEEYNETEALRYCNDAIEIDDRYSDAHRLRIEICVALEKSGYQRDKMRKYIQGSVDQLVELKEQVSQELLNEYLSPRRSPRRGSRRRAGGPERGPEGPGVPAQ